MGSGGAEAVDDHNGNEGKEPGKCYCGVDLISESAVWPEQTEKEKEEGELREEDADSGENRLVECSLIVVGV